MHDGRVGTSTKKGFAWAVPDAVFVLSEEGRYLAVFPVRTTALVQRAATVRGKLVEEVLGREDAEPILRTIRTTLETGVPQTLEYSLVFPEGRRWFQGRTSVHTPLLDGHGKVLWVCSDVTDELRARDALRGRTNELRVITQAFRDLFFWLDQDLVIRRFEGQEDDLYSRPESFLGRSVREVLPPHVTQMIEVGHREALATGETKPFTYELNIGGQTRYYEARISRLSVNSTLAAIRDLTDRVQAEKAVERSEKRYRDLYDKSPVMLHSIDELGLLVSVSDFWLAKMGYERGEVLDRPLWDFMTEVSGREAQEVRIPTLIRTGRLDKVEYQFVKKSGEVIDVELSAIAERDESGNFVRSFAALTDVTEAKRSRRALEESEAELRAAKERALSASEAKTRFLANVSHEIRTPLNAIVALSELLSEQVEGRDLPQDFADHLDTIRECGTSLADLINSVLDLSRIESGKYEIHQTSCDLRAVFRGVFRVHQERAREGGIAFCQAWDDNLPRYVLADPIRLRQILINLTANAIKFTPPGGAVRLEALRSGDQVMFVVDDEGVGIQMQDQNRIFAPFEQVDPSATRRVGGTGLGLSICKELVSLMGGSIRLQSTPGLGSRFVVTLPLEEIEPPSSAAPSQRPSVRRGAIVLAVEDNPVNQRVLRLLLNRFGLDVHVASNGVEGVERAIELKPDLILMDLQMPVMDGLEATRRLRSSLECSDTTIVAMTADAFDEQRRVAFDAGVSDYMTKPISLDKVQEVLTRYLSEFENF